MREVGELKRVYGRRRKDAGYGRSEGPVGKKAEEFDRALEVERGDLGEEAEGETEGFWRGHIDWEIVLVGMVLMWGAIVFDLYSVASEAQGYYADGRTRYVLSKQVLYVATPCFSETSCGSTS